MHLLCLIYSNSSYYCKPVRIITIIREICNLIIERTVKHLDSSTIFQIEPEEASDKVSDCFKTLRNFKSCYKDTLKVGGDLLNAIRNFGRKRSIIFPMGVAILVFRYHFLLKYIEEGGGVIFHDF